MSVRRLSADRFKALFHMGLLAALAIIAGSDGYAAPATGKTALELTVPVGWTTSAASPMQRNTLSLMKERLAKDPSLAMVLVGHTDLIGSADQNLAIGYFYAQTLALDLRQFLGLPQDRFEVSSAGESAPKVTSGTFSEQAPNRRVSITLSTPNVEQVAPKDTGAVSRKVLLLEPQPGTVDRAYQRVRAMVEGRAQTALLTLNGSSTLVAVQESRIEGEVVLAAGDNVIEVIVWDQTGTFGKDRVEVTYLPPPPAIEVYEPRDGDLFDTTHSPVVKVRGKVLSTTPLKEIFMFLNGAARRIEVDRDGTFTQPIVLIQKVNTLKVEALNIFEKTATSPELTIQTMNLIPKDLVVFLTWDKPDIDLDLHMRGPGDKHTFFGALDPFESRDAIPGGGLDIDDKNGFGPEVFTLFSGQEGTYTVQALYHHSPTGEPCNATVTVVLHPAEPARRLTRVFGPRKIAPGSLEEWNVTAIEMPMGTFPQ